VRVSRYGEAQVRVSKAGAAGGPAQLGYTTFDVAESARYGHAGPLAAGAAIVNERLARDLDVGPGSTVRVGAAELEIVQVFAGFGDAAPRLLVDVAALPAIGLTATFDRLGVYLGDLPIEGASTVAVSLPVSRVEVLTTRLAERFPALEVVGRELLRQRAFELFDRTFAMTRALTLLALLVAGVGIYNALTALRLNQAPTRRLLEAQGVLAHELALVTFARAGIVGLISVGVAAPLGIGMAWVLCQVINPRAFGWTVGLVLETRGWLPPLALGLGASLLAGLLPAPRERGALDEAV
jgi:putative ABC transport system permease protein